VPGHVLAVTAGWALKQSDDLEQNDTEPTSNSEAGTEDAGDDVERLDVGADSGESNQDSETETAPTTGPNTACLLTSSPMPKRLLGCRR